VAGPVALGEPLREGDVCERRRIIKISNPVETAAE